MSHKKPKNNGHDTYQLTTKGYESLGVETISQMIRRCEQTIDTNKTLLDSLMQAYNRLVSGPKDRV